MALKSTEMRRLAAKWTTGNAWPKRLEWMEIKNVRGWSEQRISFEFPITAIVGENGSGKSTVLQCAACSYKNDRAESFFPTEFFPETTWDNVVDARIRCGHKRGNDHFEHTIRKPGDRWLGQVERPERALLYLDLSRLQPIATRVGYARIAKLKHTEQSAQAFTDAQVGRMSGILGRHYDSARMATSSVDENREIPVLIKEGRAYSGYHQGSGEMTIAELIRNDLPKYGLVLIDEIESSLHPRAQRRLIRDLAAVVRERECQIILTTHSPFILDELPVRARTYILETGGQKDIAQGVSPQFAMTKMDEESYPDCELYVEDSRAQTFLSEILSKHAPEEFISSQIVPYGAANLGVALGEINANKRFPRATVVFLDGDQSAANGCVLLPGDDAPERVVFERLRRSRWQNLWVRLGRDISDVSDACERAMTLNDHHDWIRSAANTLRIGGDALWQAMCNDYASMASREEVSYIRDAIIDAKSSTASPPHS